MITGTEKTIPMVRSRRGSRILIAGLGNVLLKDDGMGVHAVRELKKNPPPGVLVVEVGTAVLDALHLFEWADKILAIDAMEAGGFPGTIYSFGMGDVAEGPKVSLHELSLRGALRFLPRSVNPEIAVLGVEPEIIDYDLNLSPSLQRALPRLLREAKEIIARWQGVRGDELGQEGRNPLSEKRSTLEINNGG